jgi:hypothetical protein
MRSQIAPAIVAPALAIAGVWGLLALDPMKGVRDRLSNIGIGRADATVNNLYVDPLTQEPTNGDHALQSLRRLEPAWCDAAERTRFVLMGNSQTLAIILAPSERPVPRLEKTYPDLLLDMLHDSGASVRGYRLSAPNISYAEALWYLEYLLSHRCVKPTDLILQLNFETFRKTGIRNGMLELLDDPAFAAAAESDAASPTPYGGAMQQAIDRYRTRLASTKGTDPKGAEASATGVTHSRGLGGVFETRVRALLDRSAAFRSRTTVKGELVGSLYFARIRLLNITTSSKRSIGAATMALSVSAIERIGQLCRANGIRLTLFNAPQNPLVPLYQTDQDREEYHGVIADLERRHAWRSFDFEDAVPKEMWGMWIDGPDPIHLGRAGHTRFAELLFGAGVIPRD